LCSPKVSYFLVFLAFSGFKFSLSALAWAFSKVFLIASRGAFIEAFTSYAFKSPCNYLNFSKSLYATSCPL
jgi:hypothetical protein